MERETEPAVRKSLPASGDVSIAARRSHHLSPSPPSRANRVVTGDAIGRGGRCIHWPKTGAGPGPASTRRGRSSGVKERGRPRLSGFRRNFCGEGSPTVECRAPAHGSRTGDVDSKTEPGDSGSLFCSGRRVRPGSRLLRTRRSGRAIGIRRDRRPPLRARLPIRLPHARRYEHLCGNRGDLTPPVRLENPNLAQPRLPRAPPVYPSLADSSHCRHDPSIASASVRRASERRNRGRLPGAAVSWRTA
jgi:hypothetical protein